MKVIFVHLVLFSIGMYGCCPKQHRVEPSYPSNVTGWQGGKEENGLINRTFVLKKGETTDNGKVQVKLLNIIPPDPCAEASTFQRQARARIQFIRLSDQKVLCEDVFAERGGALLSSESCRTDPSDVSSLLYLGISSITIIAINLKEEWVFFGL